MEYGLMGSSEYNKAWRKRNPGKASSYTRKYNFGVTEEQFQAMAQAQNGLCAICKLAPEDSLCIDHDHITNKIRALLCRKCNSSVGHFKEDVELLMRVKNYLEMHT